MQIGYNRAARIIDQMEEAKIISPANHTRMENFTVMRFFIILFLITFYPVNSFSNITDDIVKNLTKPILFSHLSEI